MHPPPVTRKNFSSTSSAIVSKICILFRLIFLLIPSAIPHNVHGSHWHDQQQRPYTMGNLFIVFKPSTGVSMEHSPLLANLSSLWCCVTSNGTDKLRIKKANFVHVGTKPEKMIPARYNGARDRAFLDFGITPITSIGKYRCQIQTEDGEMFTGNMFVHMRPILLLNSTQQLDPVDGDGKGNGNFAWIDPISKAREGHDAVLNCPAIGFPEPEIRWYKNGKPINTSEFLPSNGNSSAAGGLPNFSFERPKYSLTAQSLRIHEMNDSDEGTYKCVATNDFPLRGESMNGKLSQEFSLSLEQNLRMKTTRNFRK